MGRVSATKSFLTCLSLLGLMAAGASSAGSAETKQATSLLGRKIDDFELRDFRGKAWTLAEFEKHEYVAVAFLGIECPLVKLYSSRLAEISQQYSPKGVAFIGINSNQQDSITELAHFARAHKIEFPLLKDPGNVVADRFGAERTPEVFVLDSDRKVRYHGRIDDQYTYGLQRPKALEKFLIDALDDLQAGRDIAVPETEVVGCLIGRVFKSQKDSEVTYSRQISRILQNRCVQCHRAGEIAPFSLTSYEDVVGWAEMIDEVVRQQRMPPWHANPEHGQFSNDAKLSEEEKELIYRWVAAGAPEGDAKDLPPPREFTDGWRIGEPDQIVYMSDRPFKVQATGEVRYQYFQVDPGWKEDKWIKAAECRPGNRAVVHHIIVAVPKSRRGGRGAHGELNSVWLAATAPGARPMELSDGMAKFVPAGSKLLFQMHYTPIGTTQEDRSSVGFIFADPKEVRRQVATLQAATRNFEIPRGASNHRVESSYTFRDDSLLLTMFPHMHLRGKSFRYEAIYPGGKSEILLDVPAYDFNWQNTYVLAEPKSMPAGTKLRCVAHFDNSEENLANPNPRVSVRWGDQTWEEMMIGYFDVAPANAIKGE